MPPPSLDFPSIQPSISPRNSAQPLLQEYQQDSQYQEAEEPIDPRTGKRRLFGFGKKREERPANMNKSMMPHTAAAIQAMRPASPLKNPSDLKPHPIPVSPSRTAAGYQFASVSPSRPFRSSSPRIPSPASSQIFERNVQEKASTMSGELSPAHIPSHVITEDHIPPALEATTEAITNEKLNPDDVEIVTSTAHQSAAAPVLERSTSHVDLTSLSHRLPTTGESESVSVVAPSTVGGLEDDGASSYGTLDPNDVRRLSFISFADVVQSEQQQQHQLHMEGSRDSLHMNSLPSGIPSFAARNRSSSPLRSLHSHSLSGGVTTPPPPIMGEVKSVDESPVRSVGSPSIGSSMTGQHGELTIETMRQAVRKTASGDLGGYAKEPR